MPAELVKFRCYRCNQLLAVSPSKVGAIVACPKCQADLVVPGAETQIKVEPRPQPKGPAAVGTGGPGEPTSRPVPLPGFFGETPPEIPAEVADLRPEDLRVEAEFFANLTRKPPEPEPIPAPSIPEPISPEIATLAPTPPPPIPKVASPFRPPDVFSAAPETVDMMPKPTAAMPVFAPVESVVPPIQIETTDLRTPVDQPRIVHEVILPASVVLAWSLFVLAAITLSFLAGLLVGHFLWRGT
jgi:phage FluMu protein Com